MELGVALPTSWPHGSTANIVRIAKAAEELNYSALWTYERLLRPIGDLPQPGGPPRPLPEAYKSVFEPLETLSYVAALTERIRLGTSVIDALFHSPVVLSRRFATLDQLSGGRVIAGLGQGWMPQEFETTAVPERRKGAGFDEFVAAMRACWDPDPVEYQGRFYRIAPSEVSPKPVQPQIPVLIGAMTPAGVERAARIADGINPIAISEQLTRGLVDTFRAAAADAGRDPAALSIVLRANVPVTPEALESGRPFLGGSPAQVAADIERIADLQVDQVLFANAAPIDIDAQVGVLEALQSAVNP
ncbi:MAG TPA: TIGR03619 family F420-dependent LLM class oxidoreductase [Mycobacterium sp.]